jgi:hypothetical protein
MVAHAEPMLRLPDAHHQEFLILLPAIRSQASHAFRRQRAGLREELVSEVIANAFHCFTRLVARGKAELAYATPLAQFAIRQVRAGRRVGSPANKQDITSHWGRKDRGTSVVSFGDLKRRRPEWEDALLEDHRATPADLAAARIDVQDWLNQLPRRDRGIAVRLAMGDRTGHVAQQFGVSAARISQLRQELEESWQAFQGETTAPPLAAA